MEGTCRVCGAHVTMTPMNDDEWQWVDDSGKGYGEDYPPGYFEPGFWDRLAAVDIGAYSALSARVGLGECFVHPHRPTEESITGRVEREVPECCGYPMRLAPRGWVCRHYCGNEIRFLVSA